MPLRISAMLDQVHEPPVAQTKTWIANRVFPPELPLIDISQAVPGYPPSPELREHLAELVRAESTSLYASSLGLDGTRSALARHMARSYLLNENAAAALKPDHIMITTGCNQAFCLAIGALCAPGDDVLVPTPFYFNHDMWLKANGINTVQVQVRSEDGMLPTIDGLEAGLTARTRAVVFVTPNNPCGVEYPPDLIEAGYAFAQQHNLALILDETYKDFRTTNAPSHHLFTKQDWPETLVHLFSFSKVFSIPGYRVGSLIAAPQVLDAAMKLADCETIGAPRVSQLAVEFALNTLDPWVSARRSEMHDRVQAFTKAMAASSDPSNGRDYEVIGAGAFFAYVRHPFTSEPATTVARRLADDHNLLTIPGEYFGEHQTQFLRLAFGNIALDTIPTAVERLRDSTAITSH